jgi:catalase
MRRMDAIPGRVSYEPNSLDPSGPRENPATGFRTFARQEGGNETGGKLRIRPESFADHYSQARQFYRSMTASEQRHIQNAFSFEFSKVESPVIRQRMLGHLAIVDTTLCKAVETAIGMDGHAVAIKPFREPIDLAESPALSLIGKAIPTLKGRKIGVLVCDGADASQLTALRVAVEKEHAELAIVALKIGGVTPKGGKALSADMALSGAPSVLFDAVVLLVSEQAIQSLLKNASAIDWVRDAFGHLKAIGYAGPARLLFDKAGISGDLDEGVIAIESAAGIKKFVSTAKHQRVWDREFRLAELE